VSAALCGGANKDTKPEDKRSKVCINKHMVAQCLLRNGVNMKDTLDKILQVETKSEGIRKDSKTDAQKIKDAAINSGRELVKEKKRDATRESHEIIVNANKNADEMIAGIRQEIIIENKNLTAIAERNMKKAAEYITERVMRDI